MRSSLAIVVLIVGGVFTGCSVTQVTPDCRAAPTPNCVADLALASLELVEEAGDRAVAGADLALALHALGRRDQAERLLTDTLTEVAGLEDPAGLAVALNQLGGALAELSAYEELPPVIAAIREAAENVTDVQTRWDRMGQLAELVAHTGDFAMARSMGDAMPESTENLKAFKGRTLSKIGVIQAKRGDLEAGAATVRAVTIGLPYYQAVGRIDIAALANKQDKPAFARQLLQEAVEIGRERSEPYFAAGILRDIAAVHAKAGNQRVSNGFFLEALGRAQRDTSPQRKARAMSRVATVMADVKAYDLAEPVYPDAIETARRENAEQLKYWSFYEIAGSAAFAGRTTTALQLLAEIPADMKFGPRPLAAATQRDVAWGHARHGQIAKALDLAESIPSPRERAQALARIARLLEVGEMDAFPRYL